MDSQVESKEISIESEEVIFRAANFSTFHDDDKVLTISFSSETPVPRGDFYEILSHEDGAVDLSVLKSQNGRVFAEHDNSVSSHVGNIQRVWLENGKGYAEVRFGDTELANNILKNVRNQTPPGISVGYLIKKIRKEEPNIIRVTSWLPTEISVVGQQADVNIGFFRSLNSDSEEFGQIATNNPSIVSGEKIEDINTNTNIQSPNKESRKMEVQENQVDVQALIAAERKRSSDIQSLAKAFSHVDEIETLAERSIASGEDVASFQSLILEKMKNVRSNPIAFGQAAQVTDNVENDPKKGFRNFKEFVSLVIGKDTSEIKKRAAPSVYSNVTNGADGGYAIPEEFANNILDVKTEQTSLLQYANQTPITNNSMSFPFNQKQPWNGGVIAYWRDEAEAATQTKPSLNRLQLNLKALTALCPVTDEMLQDSQAMASFLINNMNEAVTWKINDAIINGNGSGQPTGILSTNALVAVAKETSQTADTILAANLAKMYGSMIRHTGNLIFAAHPDTLGQIMTLTLGDKPVWLGDFSQTPGGMLLGRPLVLTDACATLGDQGDIILADMSGYYAITKAGGAEFAQSMHLWFDQSMNAFRLTFRMDGSPIISEAITPAKGSNKRSFFATIAARA